VRAHHAVAVAEIRERCTLMITVGGESGGERAIDRLPRGEVLRRPLHLAFTAFGAEIATHAAVRRRQGARAVGQQELDQFPLHDDAGTARLHRAGDALVDLYIKARPAQRESRAEPADGTARDSDPEWPLSS
jgi:hypothetical protein